MEQLPDKKRERAPYVNLSFDKGAALLGDRWTLSIFRQFSFAQFALLHRIAWRTLEGLRRTYCRIGYVNWFVRESWPWRRASPVVGKQEFYIRACPRTAVREPNHSISPPPFESFGSKLAIHRRYTERRFLRIPYGYLQGITVRPVLLQLMKRKRFVKGWFGLPRHLGDEIEEKCRE